MIVVAVGGTCRTCLASKVSGERRDVCVQDLSKYIEILTDLQYAEPVTRVTVESR